MKYKRLFILVEGDDDEEFFMRGLVKSIFEEKYDAVMLWKYSRKKNEKIDDFLRNIKAMNADYIYTTDINLAPCVTAKKREIQDKFRHIDEDRIIVVIKEIESWYLAGIDDKSSKKLRLRPSSTTDNITKEQFNRLIPKKFDSRIDFMSEILKHFSIEIAKQKNKSFRYFLEKYDY